MGIQTVAIHSDVDSNAVSTCLLKFLSVLLSQGSEIQATKSQDFPYVLKFQGETNKKGTCKCLL